MEPDYGDINQAIFGLYFDGKGKLTLTLTLWTKHYLQNDISNGLVFQNAAKKVLQKSTAAQCCLVNVKVEIFARVIFRAWWHFLYFAGF